VIAVVESHCLRRLLLMNKPTFRNSQSAFNCKLLTAIVRPFSDSFRRARGSSSMCLSLSTNGCNVVAIHYWTLTATIAWKQQKFHAVISLCTASLHCENCGRHCAKSVSNDRLFRCLIWMTNLFSHNGDKYQLIPLKCGYARYEPSTARDSSERSHSETCDIYTWYKVCTGRTNVDHWRPIEFDRNSAKAIMTFNVYRTWLGCVSRNYGNTCASRKSCGVTRNH